MNLKNLGLVVFTLSFRKKQKQILFYRDFVQYTGGHQKVADYVKHLSSTCAFVPTISFSNRSIWNDANPWFPEQQFNQSLYRPEDYDYAFLAGMDWQEYLKSNPVDQPVINLIQHVRHADPTEDVHQFLSQKAIRICVSHDVADAITQTGKVNGPVFTIPNGLDLPKFKSPIKQYDVLILGNKQPVLARELNTVLQASQFKTYLIDELIPRNMLHQKMAQSSIALLLPHFTEGFYLPAIEAMHFCDLVIVPDCIGNRSFCQDQQNCLMPNYNVSCLLQAVEQARLSACDSKKLKQMKNHATATVVAHSLKKERKAFLNIMHQLDNLWRK